MPLCNNLYLINSVPPFLKDLKIGSANLMEFEFSIRGSILASVRSLMLMTFGFFESHSLDDNFFLLLSLAMS